MAPRHLLAAVWFFVLGGFGLFFPFYSLYLRENLGLAGMQIGAVMAMPPLVGLVAQPFWGQVADRTGLRSRVVAVLALGTAGAYFGLSLPERFVTVLGATALLALFSAALIPSLVAASLAILGERGGYAFGRVRVWGTLGFAVSVGSFPFVLDRLQTATGLAAGVAGTAEAGLGMMFPCAAAFVAVGAVTAWRLPRRDVHEVRAQAQEWRVLLHNRAFLGLLAVTFVAYFCLQGPMALFPIFVQAQGGGVDAISRMWLLMLALEIPLVFRLGAGIRVFGARGVIAIGIFAGGLRWVVTGFAGDLAWTYPAQILHGVVVWGLLLGAPVYANAVVPARLRSTGQGVLAMVGISAGGILSNLTAGALIDAVGPSAPARFGGIGALMLGCLLPWLLPAPPEHADD